jgi:ABC-type spermidine/putrescine transport system permease subunit I
MEYYDGDSLTIEINLVSNCVYFLPFYAITVYTALATIANQKLQAHSSLCCKPHLVFLSLVVSQLTRSCNQTLL